MEKKAFMPYRQTYPPPEAGDIRICFIRRGFAKKASTDGEEGLHAVQTDISPAGGGGYKNLSDR
jgi:hypothetical protein